MRAAYVRVPMKVELREIEVPEPDSDQVLVKIDACAVCGTDIHFSLDLAKREWMPLGHELCGSVAKLGPGVSEYKLGQRVIVENHTYCGRCYHCKNGDVVHCTTLHQIMHQAGMADFILVHRSQLHPYSGLTPAVAAIAEPLTVALDVVESSDIPLNGNVVIFGPGPIGLMCLRVARLKGARRVIMVGNSHSRARLTVAKEFGADRVLHADRHDVVKEIVEMFPDGVERCLVTSPPQTILTAMKVAAFGGIVTFNGIKFDKTSRIRFDANEFHFRRLQLRATHSIPNLRFPMAIDMLQRGIVDGERLISHTYKLQNVARAMRTAATDKKKAIKVVVRMSDE